MLLVFSSSFWNRKHAHRFGLFSLSFASHAIPSGNRFWMGFVFTWWMLTTFHKILMFYSTNSRVIGASCPCFLLFSTKGYSARHGYVSMPCKTEKTKMWDYFVPPHAYQSDGFKYCSCGNVQVLKRAADVNLSRGMGSRVSFAWHRRSSINMRKIKIDLNSNLSVRLWIYP